MSMYFAAAGPAISLVAAPIFQAGPIRITNSSLYGFIGTLLLLIVFWNVRRQLNRHHYTRFAIAVLWVYETLMNTVEEVLGDREKARRLAPLALTIFFLVIVNNWLEVLPFIGTISYHQMPLFRGLAADLNFTLALAIITMVTAQIWAIRSHGFAGNLGRYFAKNPLKQPMHAFSGFLELIAEFSRLIALSMRLFGNIFGGEVLLAVIGFLSAWAAPISLPLFMGLEIFVGAIQAYVFFMLTVVFVALGSMGHDADPTELGAVSALPAASSQ